MSVQEQLRKQQRRFGDALGTMTERQVVFAMYEVANMANRWREKNNHTGYLHNVEMLNIARRHLYVSRTEGASDQP